MVIEMSDKREDKFFVVIVDGRDRLFSETNLRIFMQQVIAAGVTDEDFEMHLDALSDAVERVEAQKVA